MVDCGAYAGRMVRWGAAVVLLVAAGVSSAVAAPSLIGRLRSKDAAERRAVLLELAETPVPDLESRRRPLVSALGRLLDRDPVPDVRSGAALVLARLGGEDAVAGLVEAIRTERDPAVAAGLVLACRSLHDESARRPLSKIAFSSKDIRAAVLAAEAVGALPDGVGRDDLLALLDAAPHWAVAAGACRGLVTHRDRRVPAALVKRLRHPDPAVRAAARDTLAELCGVDHGIDPAVWESWWALAGKDFEFPDRRDDALPQPAGDRNADGRVTSDDWTPGNRPTFARFFGIELRGRRVCFVIDFSQSMWGPRRNRAQKELIDAVKGLPAAHTFGVILFNEKVWWFDDGPLPAHPQQKLDLTTYLPEQETKSYTNIYDSLERALGLIGTGSQARDPAPGLDEIVLLSDGVPNRGKLKDTKRILEAIELLNGGRVRIHTVSLGAEELDLLPALAKQNGGRHVRHAFPK